MVDRVLSKGMALDRNEVKLRNRLEAVRERLNRPTEFKARLNELMALQRMQVRPASTRRCGARDITSRVFLLCIAARVSAAVHEHRWPQTTCVKS